MCWREWLVVEREDGYKAKLHHVVYIAGETFSRIHHMEELSSNDFDILRGWRWSLCIQ